VQKVGENKEKREKKFLYKSKNGALECSEDEGSTALCAKP
jgi:hypothetical protein